MTTAQTSKTVLTELGQFLNNLERKTYRKLVQYHQEKGEWPTYKELARYMNIDKNTIQPRISEMKDAMIVTEAGKRPCKASKHDISVKTWKTVINHQTNEKEGVK